jgi:type III restriction enzyme
VADGADDEVEGDDDERPVRRLTKQEQAERLRIQVDTVGQLGKPGERIQNVISVGMLTEGWDARTVTHIMGLRAFSSQLLCEQVVGRGLRRTSYEIDPATGRFPAEHVNIFGIPFTFLPHEGGDAVVPPPPPPKSRIEPVPDKRVFEITWPNVVRIEHTWTPRITLDLDSIATLRLDATETPTLAQLAPVVEGKPDVSRITEIDLEGLGGVCRRSCSRRHAMSSIRWRRPGGGRAKFSSLSSCRSSTRSWPRTGSPSFRPSSRTTPGGVASSLRST